MSLPRRALNVAWVVVAVTFGSAMFIAALGQRDARTPDEHVLRIAGTIKCPTCIGQSVAQSEAPASRDIRVDIARRIAQGESDDQIRQDLASRFGPDILLSPSHSGVVGLVWILPVLMSLVVVIGLMLAFRRWRLTTGGEASEADRVLVTDALAGFAGEAFDDDEHDSRV